VFNIAGDIKGVQAAGVFNIAASVLGAQSAGVINIAKDVRGVQAAGVVNVARKVTGLQVGLVNLSEEMYGIPIGLFSWTKNGIRDLGFWVDGRATSTPTLRTAPPTSTALAMAAMPQRMVRGLAEHDRGRGTGLARRGLEVANLDIDFCVQEPDRPRPGRHGVHGQLRSLDDFIENAYMDSGTCILAALRGTLSLKLGKSLELFGGASLDSIFRTGARSPSPTGSPAGFSGSMNGWAYEIQPSLFCA
jgi:hypothetical protein